MIMPSHFYENHIDHHNARDYGTIRDGEYLPLGAGPAREILVFFAQVPLLPGYIALRLLFAPLSFLHPRARGFALERMSSYVINFRHRLTVRPGAPRKAWAALEIACSLRVALMLAIVLVGVYPASRLAQLYALAVFTMLLNYIRNLVAHRYQNTGGPMTHAEQLADSITITGHPLLTELFFPLGLRYHALHHLFPGIPYHNLGIAHRRLMAQLSPDAPYRQTVFKGYWAALGTLLENARTGAASRV
jgi:fatty acid desaturase